MGSKNRTPVSNWTVCILCYLWRSKHYWRICKDNVLLVKSNRSICLNYRLLLMLVQYQEINLISTGWGYGGIDRAPGHLTSRHRFIGDFFFFYCINANIDRKHLNTEDLLNCYLLHKKTSLLFIFCKVTGIKSKSIYGYLEEDTWYQSQLFKKLRYFNFWILIHFQGKNLIIIIFSHFHIKYKLLFTEIRLNLIL